jgi:hypothetical protein
VEVPKGRARGRLGKKTKSKLVEEPGKLQQTFLNSLKAVTSFIYELYNFEVLR